MASQSIAVQSPERPWVISSWPNKRRRQTSESRSSCPHYIDRKMVSQYPPRPRLTRRETKPRSSGSSTSSFSSTSTSMASIPSPPAMTEIEPQSHPPKSQDTPPVSTNLSQDTDEVLHLEELELMMHWCTTTYRSMARNDVAELLWQTVIPHLSLRHPALRHGLLALSALHLAKASGSPERKWRYMVSAREHQTRALVGIELDEGQDLTTAQCNATFALCCVMITFAFGYCLIEGRDDTETDEQLDVLDEFLEIFLLTRWLVCVMMGLIDRISAGELSPLVQPEQPSATMPDMSRLVILSLRRQNGIEALRDPAHERDIYDQAIGHLGALLEQLMKGGEPKMFAFCWSFRIPSVFLDLVRRRRPFALIVLAHYAVVLYHLRDSWWMGDWGTRVLEQIGDCLDSEWRQHLSWPINATGCFLPES